MVAFQGVPNAANYAASKAYVQSLGEGLARELMNQLHHHLEASYGVDAVGLHVRQSNVPAERLQ